MTEQSHHDQDADPPTPTGEEPDREQLQPDSEPASDPDPITETVDFVAGMTDRYALATYQRLFLPRGEIFA